MIDYVNVKLIRMQTKYNKIMKLESEGANINSSFVFFKLRGFFLTFNKTKLASRICLRRVYKTKVIFTSQHNG